MSFLLFRCNNNKITIFVMHKNLCHVLRGAKQQNAMLLSCKLLVKAKNKKRKSNNTRHQQQLIRYKTCNVMVICKTEKKKKSYTSS